MESIGPNDWATAAWLAEAAAFVDRELAARGETRIGELEQPHLRPWATALRAQTSAGVVWLKAMGRGTAFETRIYPLLRAVVPARTLEPLAVDETRGLLLVPDGGTTLEAALTQLELIDTFERILPQYAELQIALAPHASTLIAAGVTDMRAEVMGQRFDEASAAVEPWLTASDRAGFARVRALRARHLAACEELARRPGAATLDHGDLHPNNIFVSGRAEQLQARFYDWGDATVAHPFASLLVVLRVLKKRLDAGDDDSRLTRVRDAYFEPFLALATRAELIETAELAMRVAQVARVLVWDRAIAEHGRGDPTFGRAAIEYFLGMAYPKGS